MLDIYELERRQENCVQYIERYYANDPTLRKDEEILGHCKASLEYIPILLTLLRINRDRAKEIQNDDLWKEINRLQNRITELEAREVGLKDVFPTDIKDTHYHKPDYRLVGGEPW